MDDSRWSKKLVRVDEIEVTEALQMRANEPPSEEYEEILRKRKSEWPFPDLRCVEDGDRLLLVSGFTRLRAALKAGRKSVPVEFVRGSWKDALELAVGENAEHGYRRTKADRRRAILRAHEEGIASPTALSKLCKVSRTTVYEVLESIKPTEERAEKPKAKAKEKEKAKPKPEVSAAVSTAKAKPRSERRDACPVCGKNEWEATDAGYVCGVCQYALGEAAGADEEEQVPQGSREALMRAGVSEELKKANTDYGRLLRSLRSAGLFDATESAMLRIHKIIQEAIRKK